MEKGRARKLGEALGVIIDVVVSQVPESERLLYKERVFRELGRVCLAPRKKDEPPLQGVNELEGINIEDMDLLNHPENLAKTIKEAAQLGYNWRTKKNILLGVHDYFDTEPVFTNVIDDKDQT